MNTSRDIGAVETDGTSATVNGDFNSDGFWNCDDINALSAAIATGSTDLMFDMTGDGLITPADITDPTNGWLVGGANNSAQTGGNAFLNGDANLSGDVDGSDFGIWNTNKFASNNAWCSGDFNASGGVDGSDFGIWNTNKFQSSNAAQRAGDVPCSSRRSWSPQEARRAKPLATMVAAKRAERTTNVQLLRQVVAAAMASTSRKVTITSR